MNTKKALILTGWYEKPTDQWFPWLKQKLDRKGYQTFIPDLPTMQTDVPNMELQLSAISKLLVIDNNTSVVGHSLGCLLAMRLAERTSYERMILVAGWDFDDLTKEHRLFWKNKIDHPKIKQHIKEIYCISSDNDPYITTFQAEEMSKRLDGKFILIKKAGHFTTQFGIKKIPELLQYL